MPQLTIYLDRATQRQVELAARREAISLSRWARKHPQSGDKSPHSMARCHQRAYD
jgi:hypothetical protein